MRNAIYSLCWLVVIGTATPRAEEKSVVRTVSGEQARQLAQDRSGRLILDHLTALPPDAARELARHEGWLSLNGLTSLSNETAEALAQHKGQLYLDGLTRLSDEQARALAGHNGELALNGLTSLSDEVAGALAQHKGGRLSLKGLTELSPSAARALTQRKGGGASQLCLDGLTTLSPEVAGTLAPLPGFAWNSQLPKIRTVSDEVAKALAKREGGLSMEGLTELSGEAATVLGPKLNGRLPALKSLSPELARALARTRGAVVLDGLTTLADDAAAALANDQHRGDLHLNGLTTLSPAAARSVCKREGDLYLNGLTTIPDETLKALAEHKSPAFARPVVFLKGLTTLSDDGAALLAAWPKWCGDLPALPTLSEKAATALAASRHWNGSLPTPKTLSPALAHSLAKRRGTLTLAGLTELSDEAATALAEHRDGYLSLDGVASLSPESAAALARHDGRLSLNGLTTLSDESARALAGHGGDWLFLDSVTTLSDEAAAALARHKGVVSLTGLTKLSAEGVKRLKASARVALPEKFRVPLVHQPAKADEKFVRTFLETHCAGCHGGGNKSGEFTLEMTAKDDQAGRVAFASALERLRAGDMPPPSKKDRPDAAEAAGVQKWIEAKLDAPLAGPATYYAVKDKPIDGNRLPHAILFGGPRGPGVPPPPRLWRLSPTAYHKLLAGDFSTHGLQQPFGLIQEPGFRDFAALYAPDEGATSLLLANAEQIVAAQVRAHQRVNIVETPNAAKETLWPNAARIKTATPAEQEKLQKGVRVRQGNGTFAPLVHPDVRPNKEELEKAVRQQYQLSIARPPSEKELASVVALYDDVARDGDLPLAGKTVLMAPLMTPEAILRFEVGLVPQLGNGVS